MWIRTTVGWRWFPVTYTQQGIPIIIPQTEDQNEGRLSNNSSPTNKINNYGKKRSNIIKH
jgi:hypothetical protein